MGDSGYLDGLATVPFIPILRDIPRRLPIHRLTWRGYYGPQSRQGTPIPIE